MPKNIVICCDGTGNKYSNRNTNVVKLHAVLDLDDTTRQVAYYHAGLGTMGSPNALTRLASLWTKTIGLAFGYGFTRDVGDAYAFLMDTFERKDRVFLFGFSRGAYTVRALAGLLHMFGLVPARDYDLIPYATEMLKRKQDPETFDEADGFKSTFSRECKPYFIGVWDTVSSVGWVWDPTHIPYTRRNPDLSIGRHAISIDERRCFFRQNLWGEPLPSQNIKQVWFAGVHSDVGGGYVENESGLAKISLEWMLREAALPGLAVKDERIQEVLGRRGGNWVKPDAPGTIHNSLRESGWWLLEPFPHRYWDSTCHPPREKIGFPFGRRRLIPPGAAIHESVLRRMALHIGYNPGNLPEDRQVEPWVPW